ncbi:hypothetical protein [Streptomyces sp. OE57]|uniref:hypothetical protein n=1 Tax=Streptomyces lacaronensis TaxID=3379885 RepID=UPI0039B78AD6
MEQEGDVIAAGAGVRGVADEWRISVWPSGWRRSGGRALVDQIWQDAPPLLRPRGVLLLVHSALCGIEVTVEWLGRAGLR